MKRSEVDEEKHPAKMEGYIYHTKQRNPPRCCVARGRYRGLPEIILYISNNTVALGI
jgi:hypothetical protein